jgi:hypothetical protein
LARIFVSYASRDRELAARIADMLKAQGVDLFLDTAISSGEEFSSRLQRELRAAEFVVALFTPAYIHSRIATYEARAAREMGRLIPVVFGGAADQLPSEFRDLPYIDGESPDWETKLRTLVERRLSGLTDPDVWSAPNLSEEVTKASTIRQPKQARHIGTLLRQDIRIQSLAWLSIGGAAVTLAGNLDAFLVLANWVEWISVNWNKLITWFWNFVIPFDIRVLPEDAVIFTFLAILFFNLLVTSADRERNVAVRKFDVLYLVLLVGVTAYIALIGFIHELDHEQIGLTDFVIDPVVSPITGRVPPAVENTIEFAAMTGVASIVLVIFYVPIAFILAIRPNVRAFGTRLQNILVLLALIALSNQVSLSLQSREWQDLFRTVDSDGGTNHADIFPRTQLYSPLQAEVFPPAQRLQ